MASALAVVELCVELDKFVNIELFHRGWYSVRARLQFEGKARVTSATLLTTHVRSKGDGDGRWVGEGQLDAAEPSVTSAPLQIAYKREYAHFGTGIKVAVVLPFEAATMAEQLRSMSATLHIELLFNSNDSTKLKLVASRSFKLNQLAVPGIFFAQPVEFDFYHTCSVQLSVHSQFIGFDFGFESVMLQPEAENTHDDSSELVNRWGSSPVSSPATLLFSHLPVCNVRLQESTGSSLFQRLGSCSNDRDALEDLSWHSEVQDFYRVLSTVILECTRATTAACTLLRHQETSQLLSHSVAERERALANILEAGSVDDAAVLVLTSFIALSERLLVLWGNFREDASFQERLFHELCELTLAERHERVVHGYFVHHATPENHHADSLLPDSADHAALACKIRSSDFFSKLPRPNVECLSNEHNPSACPIIFEERWWRSEPKPKAAFVHDGAAVVDVPVAGVGDADNADDADVAVDSIDTFGFDEDADGEHRADGAELLQGNGEECEYPADRDGGDGQETTETKDSGHDADNEEAKDEAQAESEYQTVAKSSRPSRKSAVAAAGTLADLELEPQHAPDFTHFDAGNVLAPSLLPHPERLLHLRNDLSERCNLHGAFYWDVEPHRARRKHALKGFGGDHLVVFVHGLSGNQFDLRLLRLRMEAVFPGLKYLMSQANQDDTHVGLEMMTNNFVQELKPALQLVKPARVSFVGHSLGSIIIRSALSRPDVQEMFLRPGEEHDPHDLHHRKPILWTYTSLSGPHLGSLYQNGLISTGMWLFSKLKRSATLRELSLTDDPDPRKCFMYRLSKTEELSLFRHVLLVASPQDKYVPTHSALLVPCPEASSDPRFGPIYSEMLDNLTSPLFTHVKVARLRVVSASGSGSLNNMIGRAAHIAMLEDPMFVQKFVACAGHYFE